MNYYSIEFFKYYLKRLNRQCGESDTAGMQKTILHMINYIQDREKNNESAYKKSWMHKPIFK